MSDEVLDTKDRMALAYAPGPARPAWQALLQFEKRLAQTARPGRDPLMIQLRLAWWRDRLAEDPARWPVSEPVLTGLKVWGGKQTALASLVDGWEALIVGEDGGRELASGRVIAYEALAALLGVTTFGPVRAAVSDLENPLQASRLPAPLPRAMRPLAVLRAFAIREARGGKPTPFADLFRIIRAGLLGR